MKKILIVAPSKVFSGRIRKGKVNLVRKVKDGEVIGRQKHRIRQCVPELTTLIYANDMPDGLIKLMELITIIINTE